MRDKSLSLFGSAMSSFPARRRRGGSTVAVLPLSGTSPRMDSAGILDAYGRDGWLQSTVSLIADGVADARWHVLKGDIAPDRYAGSPDRRKALAPKLTPMPHHELEERLSNPGVLSARATFRTMAIHALLLGESILFRTQDGRLFPLPPSAVQSTPTLGSPTFKVSYQSIVGEFGPDSVIYLGTGPNPLDPLGRCVGIGHGLSDNVSATEAMEETIRSTYQRGGVPVGLIGVDSGEGVPTDLEDLQKKIAAAHAGAKNAGKLMAVSGRVTSSAVQANFRDLDAANLAAQMRENLRQTLRIPREMMGDSSESTRAATEAAVVHAFKFAVRPLLEALRAEMQLKLAPLYDVGALIEYEVESPEQSDLAVELATNAVTCNAFTVQEIRGLAGFDQEIPAGQQRIDPAPGTKPLSVLERETP